MINYTLWEKIVIFSKIIINSPLFLIILLGIVLMFIDLLFVSKKDPKTKYLYLGIGTLLIGLLIYTYFSSFLEVIDSINKSLITFIYFPTVLEYMIILVIMILVILFSVFSKKSNNKIKVINSLVSAINILIFFIILDQIAKLDVDLTNKLTIYSNSNLMTLFEISIIIFIAWLTGVIIIKIIHKLIKREVVLPVIDNFYEEPELPATIEELRKENKSNEYLMIDKVFTLDEYYQIKELLLALKNIQNKSN